MKNIDVSELLTLEGAKLEKVLNELSFEQGLAVVEELVSSVESGSLPLEASLKSYESGVAILTRLREILNGAEERLTIINKK